MHKTMVKYFNQTELVEVEAFDNLNEYIEHLKTIQRKRNIKPVIFFHDEENNEIVFKHMTKKMPALNYPKYSLFQKNGITFDYDNQTKTYAVPVEDFLKIGFEREMLTAAKPVYVNNCYSTQTHFKRLNVQIKGWVNTFMVDNKYRK